MSDLEQAIREHAYHLWVESGCQDGGADTHWIAAQREILSASIGENGRVRASDEPAKSEKPKKTARKKKAA